MRDRGKAAVENFDMEYYCSSSEMPCSKHPNSSSIGICACCLKERLALLVCSDCGEQRLSSCSCSEIDISSNRNSCTGEVGSVGRVSFLIENEKNESLVVKQHKTNKSLEKDEQPQVVLRRSSSSCNEIKRSKGFWRFGKSLFRKKRVDNNNNSTKDCENKSEMWLVDENVGMSRSRSLCSFRNGSLFESEDGGDHLMVSGARSSISAARSSSVTTVGMVLDSGRKSGYSEGRKSGFSEGRRSGFSEGRKSGFEGEKIKDEVLVSGATKRVFSLKESDFSRLDESRFIDLQLDYSEAKPDLKMGGGSLKGSESLFGSMRGSEFVAHDQYGAPQFGDGIFSHSGSCRITVNERGIKRGRRSFKGGWKWILRHHPSWGSSTRRKKDEEDMMFKA